MKPNFLGEIHAGKFLRTLLPVVAALLAGVLAFLSLVVYKITHPGPVPEAINPSHYLLPWLEITISSPNQVDIPAWWISGNKGAPGIILAPGYGMNRSDALSLAATLYEKGFNILIYDQRGSGSSPRGASTLGLHEADDLARVVAFMQNQPQSNRSTIGIWGVDASARAAFKVAASLPEIRAIAADGVFEFPSDFINFRIYEDFGLDNSVLQFGCSRIFKLLHARGGSKLDESLPLEALSDRAILFIKGDNRERLAALTAALYDKVKPRKEMISIKTARVHSMAGEELKNYDRQVANFFQVNLK